MILYGIDGVMVIYAFLTRPCCDNCAPHWLFSGFFEFGSVMDIWTRSIEKRISRIDGQVPSVQ